MDIERVRQRWRQASANPVTYYPRNGRIAVRQDDIEFLVNAHQDISDLLSEVDRLHSELAEIKRLIVAAADFTDMDHSADMPIVPLRLPMDEMKRIVGSN